MPNSYKYKMYSYFPCGLNFYLFLYCLDEKLSTLVAWKATNVDLYHTTLMPGGHRHCLRLSVCLFVHMSVCLSVHLSVLPYAKLVRAFFLKLGWNTGKYLAQVWWWVLQPIWYGPSSINFCFVCTLIHNHPRWLYHECQNHEPAKL